MQHKILEDLLASRFLESLRCSPTDRAVDPPSALAAFAQEVDLCESLTKEWTIFLLRREAYRQLSRRVICVSLGEDCFPRTVLSHLGFKQTRSEGELSMPFDLMALPVSSVVSLIANDFEGLTDPANLTYNGRHPVNHLLDIDFNHEQGSVFADSQFEQLRIRYHRRTRAFLDVASRGMDDRGRKVIYCIHHYHAGHPIMLHMIGILGEALVKTGMNLQNPIMYIDNTASMPDGVHYVPDSRAIVISLRYPYDGYVWHENVHRFSLQGLRFTNELGLLIRSALELLGCND